MSSLLSLTLEKRRGERDKGNRNTIRVNVFPFFTSVRTKSESFPCKVKVRGGGCSIRVGMARKPEALSPPVMEELDLIGCPALICWVFCPSTMEQRPGPPQLVHPAPVCHGAFSAVPWLELQTPALLNPPLAFSMLQNLSFPAFWETKVKCRERKLFSRGNVDSQLPLNVVEEPKRRALIMAIWNMWTRLMRRQQPSMHRRNKICPATEQLHGLNCFLRKQVYQSSFPQ